MFTVYQKYSFVSKIKGEICDCPRPPYLFFFFSVLAKIKRESAPNELARRDLEIERGYLLTNITLLLKYK